MMEGWTWKALCNDSPFGSGRLSPPVGFEPALTRTGANRSKVGSANHLATSHRRKKRKMKEIIVLQNLLQCIYRVLHPPDTDQPVQLCSLISVSSAVWNRFIGYLKSAHRSLISLRSLNFSKTGLNTEWAHLLFCRYCCAPTNYATFLLFKQTKTNF